MGSAKLNCAFKGPVKNGIKGIMFLLCRAISAWGNVRKSTVYMGSKV